MATAQVVGFVDAHYCADGRPASFDDEHSRVDDEHPTMSDPVPEYWRVVWVTIAENR